MKQGRSSLKAWFLMVLLMAMLPLTIVFMMFNYRTISRVKDQLAANNTEMLSVFTTAVQEQMTRADELLNVAAANEAENVLDKGILLIENNPAITAVGNTHIKSNKTQILFNSLTSYTEEEKEAIKNELKKLALARKHTSGGWFLQQIGEKWFWIKIMESENKTFANSCVIDISHLGQYAQTMYGLSTPVVFVANGKPLSSAAWLRKQDNILPAINNKYVIIGENSQFMVVKRSLVAVTTYYASPFNIGTDNLGWIKSGPFWLLGAVILAMILSSMVVKMKFFTPLDDLIYTMQCIRSGDLKAHTRPQNSLEFAQVNETFDKMIEEITILRIKSYENQLVAQNAEMDALRMQIRPHFYLNNLKNLYGLAQAGDMDKIQQTILLLSAHLRYSFDLNTTTVTLEQELEMCQKYFELQAVSQSIKPVLNLSIDAGLCKIKVPPISLLSLIENSVKHSMLPGVPLVVEIGARQMQIDGYPIVIISVRDNGAGFTKQQIQTLNKEPSKEAEHANIGLANVVKRFKLLYGNDFAIAFSNKNGALVELFIPREQSKEDKEKYENTNC